MKTAIFLSIFAVVLFSSTHIQADNNKPDLWKVSKNGNVSYLFGSIHLGSPDMYPLSDAVKKAYESSQHLVVEIDLKPGDELKMAPLIQKYGLNLSTPLEKRLSKDVLAIYKKACTERALPCAQFAPYKAWLLSVQLSVQQMIQMGYKEKLGIDKHFLELAHNSKKNVIALETAGSQIKIVGGFDKQQQELMLVQSLQAKDEDYVGLFDAWKSGDDKKLVEIFQRGLDQPGAKAMYIEMFDKRNLNMVSQIEKHIKANKSLFVVVGAGHIIGENGIVDLLSKRGFKLSQIQ